MISSLYAPVYTRRACAIYIASIKTMLGGRIVCLYKLECEFVCLFVCGELKCDIDFLNQIILTNLLCTLNVHVAQACFVVLHTL